LEGSGGLETDTTSLTVSTEFLRDLGCGKAQRTSYAMVALDAEQDLNYHFKVCAIALLAYSKAPERRKRPPRNWQAMIRIK
jgi:hypothetical protein